MPEVNIIKPEEKVSGRDFVNSTLSERIKSDFINSERISLNQSTYLKQKMVSAVSVSGDTVEDQAGKLSAKYSTKAGVSALFGAFKAVNGGKNASRHFRTLQREVKRGSLTRSQAKSITITNIKKGISSGAKSIGKNIVSNTSEAINDLMDASDDLGMQSLSTVRKTTKTVSNMHKKFKNLWRSTRLAKALALRGANMVSAVAKSIASIVASPTAAIALLVIIVFIILIAIVSMIPSTTLKASNSDLSKVYEYVTELDSTLTADIRRKSEITHNYDDIRFFVNGTQTTANNINIVTNPDSIILYFDCKYEGFTYENVTSEIRTLHEQLYTVRTYDTAQEVECTVQADDGTISTHTELKNYLDVEVTIDDIDYFLYSNIQSYLTPIELEQWEIVKSTGIYTARKELTSPFPDKTFYVSPRYGWYTDSANTQKFNCGIGIPMTIGTPVSNVLTGTVTNVDDNSVTVTLENRQVTYYYISDIAVISGQEIGRGETIGKVSNGSIYLTYKVDGEWLCPSIFLDGVGTSGSGSNDIVTVALSQLGNVGGQPYWSWYGFNSRIAWCACFVSWCANECGYIDAGVVPKFSSCTSQGMAWFKSRSLWQTNTQGYIPVPGDIIFFNWQGNTSQANHVGIVERCDGTIVHTVEGNSGNKVKQKSYGLSNDVIIGYGTPIY